MEVQKPAGYAAFTPFLDASPANPARGWDNDRLFSAAREVESLTTHPGWKVVFGLLSEKKQYELDRLIHGPVVDQGTYAAVTALAAGIDLALHAADAVLYAAERREQSEAEVVNAREAASG